jgi:hypothetical protein
MGIYGYLDLDDRRNSVLLSNALVKQIKKQGKENGGKDGR